MTIKLAPAVRFPGFTDVWEQRKLTEIADYRNGKAHEQNISDNGTYVVINSKFVSTNGEVRKYSDEQIEPMKINEIAFVLSDVPNGRAIARTFLVDDNNKYTLNQRIAGITPHSNTDAYFLHQLMNRHYYFLRFDDGVKQTNLSKESVESFSESYPSHEEQTQIGNFFKNLDKTIALHQRELDNLKITKQVFMKKMFPKEGEKVPEVRFPGFMADWDYRKLGDVGETYTGLSGKSKDDFGHGRGKYVTYMNVFSNSIANPSLVELVEIDTKQNEVNPGDIFFTTSSETPEEVGMSSVWLENSDNTYLNSFCFGYRPIEKFDNYYLAYMLRSSVVRKKITFLAQGISRYNISKNKVMDIAVPIPVIEEQTKIGEFFKQLDDIINLQQQELEKLKQTKQAFLQKMFI